MAADQDPNAYLVAFLANFTLLVERELLSFVLRLDLRLARLDGAGADEVIGLHEELHEVDGLLGLRGARDEHPCGDGGDGRDLGSELFERGLDHLWEGTKISQLTFSLPVEQAMCRSSPLRPLFRFVTKSITFRRAHMWAS